MKFFVLAILVALVHTQNPSKSQCIREIMSLGPITQGRGISARGTYDMKTLLNFFDNMPTEVKEQITACKLNLAPAKARCESSYGAGNCEQITPAAFQTKCDSLFKRVGCCHCAMECPEGYKEDDYHCIKPSQKSTKQYQSLKECSAVHANCEQRGKVFTEACGIQFRRIGADKCLPVCPFGWHDEGKRCRKPANYRMAQPFFWEQGDN